MSRSGVRFSGRLHLSFATYHHLPGEIDRFVPAGGNRGVCGQRTFIPNGLTYLVGDPESRPRIDTCRVVRIASQRQPWQLGYCAYQLPTIDALIGWGIASSGVANYAYSGRILQAVK